ncbi:kit ligand a isoform X2 [Scleropages formosus]|uniref:Kit ligand n=1 Tax=Scleropages formosus TaxID=113540 RepID=A0A8C9RX34_SCLFO|nr:kit ligand isoform X2 [Scleropages formosus]
MKKAKISISVCVHFLLCATFGTSSEVRSCIADDLERISLLKQNIPKDYKITVRHIPKEVSGMCWVVLNVFHLEESLKDLAQKFGNISSNRDNIDIYVQTLQDVRFKIINKGEIDLESTMEEFQCHYREERWPTEEYFDYVKDLLNAANSKNESRGCESPLCPSATTEANMSEPHAMVGCNELVPNCSARAEHQYLPKIVEKSLLWMLIIPLAMGLLCLVWKISCRRRREEPEPNPDSGHVLTDIEGKAAPLHGQLSGHKIRLSMEMV